MGEYVFFGAIWWGVVVFLLLVVFAASERWQMLSNAVMAIVGILIMIFVLGFCGFLLKEGGLYE